MQTNTGNAVTLTKTLEVQYINTSHTGKEFLGRIKSFTYLFFSFIISTLLREIKGHPIKGEEIFVVSCPYPPPNPPETSQFLSMAMRLFMCTWEEFNSVRLFHKVPLNHGTSSVMQKEGTR